ncbi:restriction endonuclease subunit S [Salipaludibacillus neizhouensis]|uniref:restriction endonuclease subunit S n=1 Tax=Salipaludibacillus neizhouensis TaxID=885475 RepID=UPI0016013ACC|nr:restriction endonuclease subunit S [Salipaludibacillus neizhouensis]
MENKYTPEIRFSGFTGDWEQSKLGDCVNYIKGYAFKSEDYRSEGIRIVRVSDLSSNEIKMSNGKFYLDEKYEKEFKKYKLNIGDIIITTVGSKAEMKDSAVGRPIIVSKEDEGLLNQNLVKVHQINGYNSYFIYVNLLRENYTNYIATIERGNANQANIAINDLWEYTIYLASNEEQQKIGDFFKQLDDTISSHQQELTTLKQTKQGFLQKMFPKEGESVSEVRFPGFTGDWEQRKLGEVAKFINGRAYKQHELLNSGKYKVLRVGNFYTNNSWYYSDLELGEKYYAEKGDLLYTWSATFGPHIWYGDKVIYHYHIWKVDLSDNLDKQFTIQLLEYDKAKILSDKNGSTMVHVTKNGMEEKKVLLPSIAEQFKIGNFFKHLDDTIDLHQRELDSLKETKKAFLQKMFA